MLIHFKQRINIWTRIPEDIKFIHRIGFSAREREINSKM